MSKYKPPFENLTKKKFEQILTKAAQPVSEWQHGQEGTRKLDSRPSDGCNDSEIIPVVKG